MCKAFSPKRTESAVVGSLSSFPARQPPSIVCAHCALFFFFCFFCVHVCVQVCVCRDERLSSTKTKNKQNLYGRGWESARGKCLRWGSILIQGSMTMWFAIAHSLRIPWARRAANLPSVFVAWSVLNQQCSVCLSWSVEFHVYASCASRSILSACHHRMLQCLAVECWMLSK